MATLLKYTLVNVLSIWVSHGRDLFCTRGLGASGDSEDWGSKAVPGETSVASVTSRPFSGLSSDAFDRVGALPLCFCGYRQTRPFCRHREQAGRTLSQRPLALLQASHEPTLRFSTPEARYTLSRLSASNLFWVSGSVLYPGQSIPRVWHF